MTADKGSLVRRNILANYAGAATLVLVPVLTLPVYLHSLGDLQWGLVGIIATLQALLAVVDAGTSQVIIREFANRSGGNHSATADTGSLLVSCERFYWLTGVSLGAAVLLLSGPIARTWLEIAEAQQRTGQAAIIGAAFLCALQFPGTLYRGVLLGAQDQVRLNAILVSGAIIRYGGGALVVSVYPTIMAYLAWHVATLAVETLVRRSYAWNAIGGSGASAGVGRRHGQWRGIVASAGLWAVAATLGAVTAQMDKVILSRMFPVDQLASYFVASQLSLAALQLFYPITSAMLPVMMQQGMSPRDRFRGSLKMMTLLAGTMAAVGALVLLAGRDVMAWWLGPGRAQEVFPILLMLLAGVGCNALCVVGYINWLARDARYKLIGANLSALCAVLVVGPPCVRWLGIPGAAVAWSFSQLIVFLVSLDWMRDAFRKN